ELELVFRSGLEVRCLGRAAARAGTIAPGDAGASAVRLRSGGWRFAGGARWRHDVAVRDGRLLLGLGAGALSRTGRTRAASLTGLRAVERGRPVLLRCRL